MLSFSTKIKLYHNLEQTFLLIKDGNKAAFKIVFDTFYPKLYAFSLNYGIDTYGAEEVIGNTFIKLWQKRHHADKIVNPKSYLYKMVANASIDYLKDNNKSVPFDIKKHDSILMKEYIIEEEVHNTLFEALKSSPPKCRKVFELSCIEGLKYKDIAEDLQISINTVKSQRARAIELLKTKLKGHFIHSFFL